MDQKLISYILDHNLHYDDDLDDIAKKISVSATQTDGELTRSELATNRCLFKTWYDGYIFCLQIGLEKNRKKTLIKKSTKAQGGWSSRKKPYLALIGNMLAKPDVQKELGIDSREGLQKYVGEGGIKTLSDNINNLCDKYAFGGLEYIKELEEEYPTILNGSVIDIDKLKLDET